MPHSHEVLAIMDTHPTTFGRKRGCMISRCGAFILGVFFLICLMGTGFLVYHFAPCIQEKEVKPTAEVLQDPVVETARSSSVATINKKKISARLPKSVIPDSYEIYVLPFLWAGNNTFSGEVKIFVNVIEDTKNITLHAVDLKIDMNATSIKEHIPGNKNVKKIKILEQTNITEHQFYVIKTSDTLKKGMQYVVHFKYYGYLNDNLQGFYKSSYKHGNTTRWILSTQFQPTDARRVFPCFDEPAMKARFQINVARPAKLQTLSNMPTTIKPGSFIDLDMYIWDSYAYSPPMSTYLVAFVVMDFYPYRPLEANFTVWCRPEAIEQARYSMTIAPDILEFYQQYFQINYSLGKLDMIAIPDFSAGAMENWGLITFRETALLYEEGVSNANNELRVCIVIAHELAHQWFGNLVTPSWWSDLWLNEGFASYMEYVGLDAVRPAWKVLDQFVVHDMQNVFTLDALETSHPISIEVGHPDEISEIFDRISYGKGASIIRMMDHFLTNKVFKQALRNYLKDKSYQSAEQDDLWNALTRQAHKDNVLNPSVTVKEIMDTWTLQTGFPVVTVTKSYNGTAVMTICQKRFRLRDVTTVTMSKDLPLWWIPLTYTSEGDLDFNTTKPSQWLRPEPCINLIDLDTDSSEWVIFNIQQTGYYRVNYDPMNWQQIINQLKKDSFKIIGTINRAQLIDDALNLARAGLLNYTIALDVTSYLAQETEYLPWKAAITAMNYLDDMLNRLPGYDKFRIYSLKLLENVYRQVSFKDNLSDPQLTIFTRVDILTWACSFGHYDCVQNSVTQFHNWRNTPDPDNNNAISPNLKSVVYCNAIRAGGQIEWDFAWQRYLNTNVGSEKDLLLQALGCSRESWILSRYLEWTITENSGIRKQDATRVFGSVAANVIGQPLVFNFFRNKWARLKEYFGTSLLTINNIVKSSTKGINTRYELKDLVDFATEYKDELGSATRTIHQAIEQAEGNIQWLEKYHGTIRNWLERNTAGISRRFGIVDPLDIY